MTTSAPASERTRQRRRGPELEAAILDRIAVAVLAMPFDLVRHDLLMDLEPLKPARFQTIVDDIFLPLVHNGPRDSKVGPVPQEDAR